MTCIDLIVTDQPNLFMEYGVHPSLDEHCQHQIIFGELNISLACPPPYKRTVWDYSKSNVQSIRGLLQQTDWPLTFQGLNADQMTELFTNKLFGIIKANIPNKILRLNDKDPPWITRQVKTAIKRKRRIFRKFMNSGRRLEDWQIFKTVRNETSRLVVNAKNMYYRNLGQKLSDPSNGTKVFWSTMNRLIDQKKNINIPPLLENGLFVTNLEAKANIFNEFFVQMCSETLTSSTLPSFTPRSGALLEGFAINREKVLKLIRSLDSKKAHGCDEISIAMIKICDFSIVEPLCLIFEDCLETGIYPSLWKKANVIPIHKKDSRRCKTNYRPISLLPIFGKLYEKIIFDSVYSHLRQNGLLTPHQSGFQPGDSTINQLLSITHKIYCSFDNVPSLETRAVFLDLSKAFDRVWHKGLLYKLECSGISGKLLTLLRSFLINRQQRVVLNGKNSRWLTVTSGVPQGSVLGPLFFLVYINDLVDGVHNDIKLFADDTSIFSIVKDKDEATETLNQDLERVRLWAWQWKMQFNCDKTEEVIFSVKRTKTEHPHLHLGLDEVARKDEHKHLGLILDSKLDFKSHIRQAILKARRGIGMIKYLSKYVSRDVLDQVYKLYVRPHLNYGDIIFHRHDPEMILNFTQRIEQTQYSAALAVAGVWRGTNRQKLYNELGWESLYNRRWYRRLCHFFNLRKTGNPPYLFAELPTERTLHYGLRGNRDYDIPFSKTKRSSNTYFTNVLQEWNKLDGNVRNSATVAEFKRKLLAIIRPVKNSLFGVFDILGVKQLTMLRLEFSALNEHMFRHNFQCPSPMCACNTGVEDNAHFFLHCPLFVPMRNDLLGRLSHLPEMNLSNIDSQALLNLILYGSPTLNETDNRILLEASIAYIKATNRLK